MYSPDDQGEYMSLDEAPRFSMKGLSNALADVAEGTDETPAEEYTMILEVMMADYPGQPCSPAFSWNARMVMHILKSDPVLRELDHVQVDSPDTAYLSFTTSRTIRVWGRIPCMLSGLMVRAPAGRVAALEEEGLVSANPVSGKDSESEVEAFDGLNMHLTQAMSSYQGEEWKCFVCESSGHFVRDCPHHDDFEQWHWEQLNSKGAGENSQPTPRLMNT